LSDACYRQGHPCLGGRARRRAGSRPGGQPDNCRESGPGQSRFRILARSERTDPEPRHHLARTHQRHLMAYGHIAILPSHRECLPRAHWNMRFRAKASGCRPHSWRRRSSCWISRPRLADGKGGRQTGPQQPPHQYPYRRVQDHGRLHQHHQGRIWERCAQAIGAPELVTNPDYATAPARSNNRYALNAVINALTEQKSTETG
jgi:hypothetical protein